MLVGRITKTPSETFRVTLDFQPFLDTAEEVATLSTPVVELQANAWPGPWPASVPVPAPPVLPDDVTPLIVDSIFIITGGRYVQLFLTEGTDGNAYSVSFLATGSTSGRTKEVRVDATVRRSSVRAIP